MKRSGGGVVVADGVGGSADRVGDGELPIDGVAEHDSGAVEPVVKQPQAHGAGAAAAPAHQKLMGQRPEQVDVVSPVVEPKVPGGHAVAAAAPAGQKEPIGQMTAVGVVAPAGQ